MTVEEYKKLIEKSGKKQKYNNNRFENKYGKWDSEAEYKYYLILLDEQKKGNISNLRRQVTIEIQPAFHDSKGNEIEAITYRADFTYDDQAGNTHYVDVKGIKTDVYKLKYKLLAFRGVEIEEVKMV